MFWLLFVHPQWNIQFWLLEIITLTTQQQIVARDSISNNPDNIVNQNKQKHQ
jgi:hypothetical protein